jgi:UDP-2-acetamido-3-amino-2,3-dideoxy-glucuronate N-acetyltransferase
MATNPVIVPSTVRIHSTAIVEHDVYIGPGTAIWDNVHIRHATRIGADCIVGEKSYLAPGVHIGNRVKINAFVYVCSAVTILDGVMISAGVIFTNDRYPRACSSDLQQLRSSEPDEHTLPTVVSEGATIGAGSRIGCGLTIGRFAMVGMGSIVTKSVPDFALVLGTPARWVGYVCRCGQPIFRLDHQAPPREAQLQCEACGLSYQLTAGEISESTPRTSSINTMAKFAR